MGVPFVFAGVNICSHYENPQDTLMFTFDTKEQG